MFVDNNLLHLEVQKLFSDFRRKYNKTDTIKVVVMVSGGLDSIAIAHTLVKLKNHLNIKLHFVYVDFKDYPEHKKTKEFVLSFSDKYQVSLTVYNPKNYNDTKTSAREVMKSAAMRIDSDLIITGHHADDQIETFLFRAFRGSGVEGLAAMKPLSEFKDPITGEVKVFGKPMLGIFKEDIDTWTYKCLPYVKDSSNKENGPNRNYIRNQVVPAIVERFDKQNLLSTIASIHDHLEAVSSIDTDYELVYSQQAWCISSMLSIPLMNRVFLIRRHLSKVYGFNMNKKAVTALKKVLSGDWTELRHDISEKFTLVIEGDYLKIKVTP